MHKVMSRNQWAKTKHIQFFIYLYFSNLLCKSDLENKIIGLARWFFLAAIWYLCFRNIGFVPFLYFFKPIVIYDLTYYEQHLSDIRRLIGDNEVINLGWFSARFYQEVMFLVSASNTDDIWSMIQSTLCIHVSCFVYVCIHITRTSLTVQSPVWLVLHKYPVVHKNKC